MLIARDPQAAGDQEGRVVRWGKAVSSCHLEAVREARPICTAEEIHLDIFGEWGLANTNDFEYNVQQGYNAVEDKQVIVKAICAGMTVALLSSKPVYWRRDRWTGSDLATDSIGLGLAVHNIGTSRRQLLRLL